MEERAKRFRTALDYLKQNGIIRTQQELADKMGSNKSTVSAAKGGDCEYLTDNFLVRFNRVVGNVFNLVWLLTGDGSMLMGDTGTLQGGAMVPCVKLQNCTGASLVEIDSDSVTAEDTEMVMSPVAGAQMAIGVYGDSMAPTYPSGCRVFIRRIDPTSFISWGSVFVLDTVNGIYIKEVQKGHDDNYILCISHNTSGRYPAFEIPLRDVFGMYRVLASISVTQ